MTASHRLHGEQDQRPWLDFVDRTLISEGKLQALVDQGIRGLTSNPTIQSTPGSAGG